MRVLLCAAMAAMLLTAGAATGQESDENGDKLYKWVDENGNVTYQDRPPPDQSGQVQTLEQPPEPQAEAGGRPGLPDVDLTLYSIEACDACDLVRDLLNERGLPFTEKDAEANVEVQNELKEVAGVLSVPALVIGDQVLTGYNKGLIQNELDEAGFPADGQATAAGEAQSAPGQGSAPLTEEETEQAAGQAAPSEDDAAFSEEDIFSDSGSQAADDDVTQWEEIPEDERLDVGQ